MIKFYQHGQKFMITHLGQLHSKYMSGQNVDVACSELIVKGAGKSNSSDLFSTRYIHPSASNLKHKLTSNEAFTMAVFIQNIYLC